MDENTDEDTKTSRSAGGTGGFLPAHRSAAQSGSSARMRFVFEERL